MVGDDGGACASSNLEYDTGVTGPNTQPTVDSATFEDWGNTGVYGVALFGSNSVYELSDGTSWKSGVGGGTITHLSFSDVVREGSTIYFLMKTPAVLYAYAAYADGVENHSSYFELDAMEDVIIRATNSGTIGYVDTQMLITWDKPAPYAEEYFNYLSTPLCSAVSVSATIKLENGSVFDERLFDAEFTYQVVTVVDFASSRQH
jgi:hypothetical protein